MLPRIRPHRAFNGRLVQTACWPLAVAALSVATVWLTPVPLVADDKAPVVDLVIDYGDGVQKQLSALPWRDEMTVLDALVAAKKHPHGITFAQRGSGSSTLIVQIDDLKNQGNGKNWLYSVNDATAKVGAGAYRLQPGDAILWEFKEYE